jgi:hypothetical protein
MIRKILMLAICFTLLATRGMTQNTFPASGNVGIGTTGPGASLDVRSINGANIYRASDSNGQYRWRVDQLFGIYLTNASATDIVGIPQSGNIYFNTGGNVGIGTTAPANILEVDSPVSKAATTGWVNIQAVGSSYEADGTNQLQLVTQMYTSTTSTSRAMGLQVVEQSVSANRNLALQYDGGNVGIGTTNPGAKLEVNGNVQLTNGSGASITFADGTTQSTAWTGTLCGGDYAESVDVSGDPRKYEPGDVLVLSDDSGSDVSISSQPYSTLVGGIYATKPGLVGRRQKGEKSDTAVPMAMVGIVPTKVSAENGPIRRGDLLVTSSTSGHAMKGTDPSRMLGAIVGKALGSLDSGTGVIDVLVSLQ